MFLPTATYSRRAYRPPPGAASGSGVAQAVVLHQALHEPVEGEVVAPELLALPVLLDGHDVEGLAAALLLGHLDGLPAAVDGLLELGHHRVVAPAGHVSRPPG